MIQTTHKGHVGGKGAHRRSKSWGMVVVGRLCLIFSIRYVEERPGLAVARFGNGMIHSVQG